MDETFKDMIAGTIAGAPYGKTLGLELTGLEEDRAVLFLPYREALTTIGTMVHGGAIASLVDVAATAACWATSHLPENPRGSTIGFSINYLDAALSADLIADARVIRRGGSVHVATVIVSDKAGKQIAHATVTYKLSGKPSGK
ncbi:PaaI family thioesterase [Tepidicaulis sp.]|uniref:PaaI family thioesterase n=1 Tax=Tepidicaulis sp. TaxID=1920809 RepID=UPI003B59FBD5